MENKNTIIENIASLKANQAKLMIMQRDFDKICNEKKGDCYALYEKYFLEAKACLEKTPQIIKPIADKFTSILSKAEGSLCLNGKKAPSASFNYATCFEVFRKAQSVFVANAKTLLTNLSTLQLSEQTMKMLFQLCSSYNTIFDFYKSTNSLFQAQWNDEYQALCSDRDSASKKIVEITNEISILERKIQVYDKDQQNRRDSLNFNHNSAMAESFADKIHIPIAYQEEDGDIGAFLQWELEKENVLCIKTSRNAEKSAGIFDIIANTVCRFINSFPAGTSRIMICDLCGDRALRNLPFQLVGNNEKITSKLIYGYSEKQQMFSTDFDDTIKTASDLITARTASYKSIYDFNAKNPDSYSSPLLIIINGFTTEARITKSIIDNIANGTQTGVYFLVTQFENERGNGYMRDDQYGFDNVYGAKTLSASMENDNICISHDDCEFAPVTLAKTFDIKRYSAMLQNNISARRSIIDLKDIIKGYTRDNTDFSEELKIPVGRSDNAAMKVLSFSSKDSSAHCVVAGATGTGKSSLLQAIVLGGAYHYSPEELEFYLIDMKDGASFYKEEGYDYSKLKHVRMMAANCKPKDLRDFIGFIKETKTHCSEASDIVAYNKNRSGSARMKRTIIIIDEYTMIDDDKCIADLERIAAQGRSFGVSLILTSQNTSGAFSKVLEKISTSVEFENIKLGELIERDGKCRISKNEALYLNEQKGNCLGRAGMSLSKFRVAYTPDQNALIEQINEKYSSYPSTPAIIIGNETRQIKAFSENEVLLSSSHDGSISVNLGKNLFGADVNYTMSNKVGSLLLLGDGDRAQSVEYSFMSAMKNTLSATDKTVFHFNFGENIITEDMENVCKDYAEISIQPIDLLHSVRSIYKIYEERKQSQKDRRRVVRSGNQQLSPILVVLHDCAQYKSLLADGAEEEKENRKENTGTKQVSTSNTTEMSAKMPDLNFDLDFSQLMQATPAQDLFASAKSNTEYADLDASKMLAEVVKNGARYNIYFVVHIGAADIGKQVYNLFGESLATLFEETIIVPEVCGETTREKMQILSALDLINKDRLKSGIEKSGEMTDQELYRCYYVVGDGYTQIIPYEWR